MRMRKRMTVFLTVACLLCGSMTAFAKDTLKDVTEEKGASVQGNSQGSKDYYEITLGSYGMASVTLPDNAVISGVSDSDEDNGLVVVIIPVSENGDSEAYAWLSSEAEAIGDAPVAYYLAFYYRNERTQPNGTVTLTMTMKADHEGGKLYTMDGTGKNSAAEISYTTGTQGISFTMAKDGYYFYVMPEEPETEETTPEETKPNGDNSGSNGNGSGDNGSNGNGSGDNGFGDNGSNGNGSGDNGSNGNGSGGNGTHGNGAGSNGTNGNVSGGNGTNGNGVSGSGLNKPSFWKGPQTGDASHVTWWIGICVLSICAIAAVTGYWLKSKKEY